ncbi:MAG TPA: tRNA (N6-threonylcarbamoyladenosine(37)-N6)-methyltransferase TrmO [Anaerolineaceae bacterium]|nr:tRNA (N6-threonylcarbamoyladenosine(37)-N6)-methyltransferase TrmO [Anaerolineaceae bacterium]
MEFTMKPIGVIHTPFHKKEETPIQSSRSNTDGTVEVFPQFMDGLDGIEGFSNIFLLYGFHLAASEVSLKVLPFLDDQQHGVFATRYPIRPNPIGLSIVKLLERENNLLFFRGADMLDGTPLLDIKPYIPEFDIFTGEKTGWYQNRKIT